MSNVSIVMYHYVRDLANSNYPDIKGLELKAFEGQIAFLKKFYSLITIEEVINAVETGDKLPPKAAILTFDDAYIDHYVNVFPILNQYNLQGSFYVPAKAVLEHTVLDVNKIHFILAAVYNKQILIDDIKQMLDLYRQQYSLNAFDWYYDKLAIANRFDSKEVIFIKRILQVELEEELRTKITNQLFAKYVSESESMFAKDLYMTTDQLKIMKKSGMHIGCHGYDHYWWNSLSVEKMNLEIDLSLNFLAQIGVDKNNWTACYPYGSYDQQSVDILKQKGCKLAVTTVVDVANTENNSRFLMPRLDTNDLPMTSSAKTNHWYSKN